MSEEKISQHYLAALHQAFPGVVLDEAWQTKDQLTITVKVNYLPEVVEFLYYQQGGWLSVLFGNDERKLNGPLRGLLRAVDGAGHQMLDHRARGSGRQQTGIPVGDAARPGGGMGRARSARYVRPGAGRPAGRSAGWCCRTTGRTNSIRCAKTAWIIASVRRRPPTPKTYPSLLTGSAAREKQAWCRSARCVTSDEPGHFRLFVDGENIIDADYRLFYVHRGMEKLAETAWVITSDLPVGPGVRHLRFCPAPHTTSVENAMGIVWCRSGRR